MVYSVVGGDARIFLTDPIPARSLPPQQKLLRHSAGVPQRQRRPDQARLPQAGPAVSPGQLCGGGGGRGGGEGGSTARSKSIDPPAPSSTTPQDKVTGTPSEKEAAATKFADINVAYETLSNEETRNIYDRFGEEGLKQHLGRQAGGGGGGGPGDIFSQ